MIKEHKPVIDAKSGRIPLNQMPNQNLIDPYKEIKDQVENKQQK